MNCSVFEHLVYVGLGANSHVFLTQGSGMAGKIGRFLKSTASANQPYKQSWKNKAGILIALIAEPSVASSYARELLPG